MKKNNVCKWTAATILTLILGCLVSSFYCVSYAVDGQEYYESIEFFSQAGVIDKESIGEQPLSRGGFIDLLMKSMNNPYDYISSEHMFNDVTAEQPWFKSLGKAYNLGLVNGYSENEFHPYELISQKQIDLVLKRLLNVDGNYKDFTFYNSITPKGEYDKIYRGVSFDNGYLDTKNALRLFYNILKVERTIIDGKNTSHDTILSALWDAYSVEGILEATGLSSIDNNSNCAISSVVISGQTFDVDINCYDYLGCYVKAYVNEDDEMGARIISIFPLNTKNNIEIISSQQIDIGCFDGKYISYEKNNQKRNDKLKISPTVSVIYNGKFVGADFEYSIFDIRLGNIKLIDNNKDNTYEVAIIENYSTIIASNSITTDEAIIADYYDSSKFIKFQDYDYNNNLEIYFDGVEGDVSKIVSMDLVNYFEIINGSERYIKAYVSRETVTGTITSVSGDYIIVEGKKILCKYQNDGGEFRGDPPSPGSYGTVRLNFMGEAEGFDVRESTDLFTGILIKVFEDNSGESFVVRMFTSGSTIKNFETPGSIIIDKEKYRSLYNITEKLTETKYSEYNLNQDLLCQLVKYRLKDGKLTEIYTSGSEYPESPKIDYPFEKRQYTTVGNVFGTNVRDFRVNQSTKFYIVPPLKDGEFRPDELTVTDLDGVGDSTSFISQAYNVNEFGEAELVVFIYSYADENFGNNPTLYLVESNIEMRNEDKEMVRKLNLFSKGSMYEFYTIDKNVARDVHPGDLVFITRDYENIIRNISVKYTLQYPRLYQGIINGDDSNYRSAARLSVSYLTAYSNGWARLTINPEKATSPMAKQYDGIWNLGALNVTLFNETGESAKKIDAATLPLYISESKGDDYLVAVYESYGQLQDCFVYELKGR